MSVLTSVVAVSNRSGIKTVFLKNIVLDKNSRFQHCGRNVFFLFNQMCLLYLGNTCLSSTAMLNPGIPNGYQIQFNKR